ncbi:hypothetical protein [Maledivibacter halophilus]|uniref:Uncharacterized protein n=1 Tax=Maledivibacter halophilus TaxID=36842 RepID=A0A1T5M2A6_9FIRM|nr:hypothetical protein [Maledivibacter halophilus]SKC82255.1 hypothetical protein SAMN02194393_03733 [Maledivibacter halophilus]
MFEGLSKKMVYIVLVLLIFNVQGEDCGSRLNNVSKLKIENGVAEKNIDNLDESVSYSNIKADDLVMELEAQEEDDLKSEKKEQKVDCEVIYEIDEEKLKKINYDNTYEKEVVEKYKKENNVGIIMDNPENYSDINGVTCFRGNNFRNSAAYGFVDVNEKKLEIIWNISIGNIGRWTGVGWNGQPAIVEWPKELRNSMNIFDEKKNKDNLKEVIYGTLDSNIYFLDLDDGSFTRNKLKIPGPIKGSVTIDPRGIPLLYVGQGINRVNNRWVKMGYRIFSLLDQKLLCFINGQDEFAYKRRRSIYTSM